MNRLDFVIDPNEVTVTARSKVSIFFNSLCELYFMGIYDMQINKKD